MADNLLGKVKNLLFDGLKEPNEYVENDYYDDEPELASPVKTSGKVVNIHPSNAQMKVAIFEPINYDDTPSIVDALKNRKAVVVNLENIEDLEVAKQIFHFLNGAIYSIDGNIKKISKAIFVLAPANVDIDGNIKKEIESKGVFRW